MTQTYFGDLSKGDFSNFTEQGPGQLSAIQKFLQTIAITAFATFVIIISMAITALIMVGLDVAREECQLVANIHKVSSLQ